MRNTDADWQKIGEEEPYYGVLTNPIFLKDNLSTDTLKIFWDGGHQDINFFLSTIRQHFGDFQPKTAIDFGCGVGRLTRAIASHVETVTGVDVSPGMLLEARKDAPANARFADTLPEAAVDWIVSHIVFQHIPPVKGYALFADLMQRLAPGGAFAIHVTLFKDKDFLDHAVQVVERAGWDGQTLQSYATKPISEGTMLMYDYNLSHLVSIAEQVAGIQSFHMVHINHGGCHGVILCGRRASS